MDDDEEEMEDQIISAEKVNPPSSSLAPHVYANDELEGRGSRAGEVYRIMREKLVMKRIDFMFTFI